MCIKKMKSTPTKTDGKKEKCTSQNKYGINN